MRLFSLASDDTFWFGSFKWEMLFSVVLSSHQRCFYGIFSVFLLYFCHHSAATRRLVSRFKPHDKEKEDENKLNWLSRGHQMVSQLDDDVFERNFIFLKIKKCRRRKKHFFFSFFRVIRVSTEAMSSGNFMLVWGRKCIELTRMWWL